MRFCVFFFENFLELELSSLFSPRGFFFFPKKIRATWSKSFKESTRRSFEYTCQASFLLYKLLTVQILQYTICVIYTTPSWVG